METAHRPLRAEAVASTTGIWFAGGIGFDWVYSLLASVLIGGVFLDGWAHNHGKVDQSFFTPWHAVLYSGFVILAAFLVLTLVVNHASGVPWRSAYPPGYGSSVVGAAVFALGGVGDLIWHTLFGIEQGIEGNISPSHLTLALGGLLLFTGPLRSAWKKTAPDAAARWVTLLPALLALTYIHSLLTFFTQYASPIVKSRADLHITQILITLTPFQTYTENDLSTKLGVTGILLETAIMMGVIFFILRRWPRLPLGSLAVLFGLNGFMMSFLAGDAPILAVAILSALIGLLFDLLTRALRPSAEHVLGLRIFAFAVPCINYVIYFVVLLAIHGSFGWSTHLWTGAIVEAGIVGLLLSYVFVPPQITSAPPPDKPTSELTGELTTPDPQPEPDWTLDVRSHRQPPTGG
jgi:hypothetical protein